MRVQRPTWRCYEVCPINNEWRLRGSLVPRSRKSIRGGGRRTPGSPIISTTNSENKPAGTCVPANPIWRTLRYSESLVNLTTPLFFSCTRVSGRATSSGLGLDSTCSDGTKTKLGSRFRDSTCKLEDLIRSKRVSEFSWSIERLKTL